MADPNNIKPIDREYTEDVVVEAGKNLYNAIVGKIHEKLSNDDVQAIADNLADLRMIWMYGKMRKEGKGTAYLARYPDLAGAETVADHAYSDPEFVIGSNGDAWYWNNKKVFEKGNLPTFRSTYDLADAVNGGNGLGLILEAQKSYDNVPKSDNGNKYDFENGKAFDYPHGPITTLGEKVSNLLQFGRTYKVANNDEYYGKDYSMTKAVGADAVQAAGLGAAVVATGGAAAGVGLAPTLASTVGQVGKAAGLGALGGAGDAFLSNAMDYVIPNTPYERETLFDSKTAKETGIGGLVGAAFGGLARVTRKLPLSANNAKRELLADMYSNAANGKQTKRVIGGDVGVPNDMIRAADKQMTTHDYVNEPFKGYESQPMVTKVQPPRVKAPDGSIVPLRQFDSAEARDAATGVFEYKVPDVLDSKTLWEKIRGGELGDDIKGVPRFERPTRPVSTKSAEELSLEQKITNSEDKWLDNAAALEQRQNTGVGYDRGSGERTLANLADLTATETAKKRKVKTVTANREADARASILQAHEKQNAKTQAQMDKTQMTIDKDRLRLQELQKERELADKKAYQKALKDYTDGIKAELKAQKEAGQKRYTEQNTKPVGANQVTDDVALQWMKANGLSRDRYNLEDVKEFLYAAQNKNNRAENAMVFKSGGAGVKTTLGEANKLKHDFAGNMAQKKYTANPDGYNATARGLYDELTVPVNPDFQYKYPDIRTEYRNRRERIGQTPSGRYVGGDHWLEDIVKKRTKNGQWSPAKSGVMQYATIKPVNALTHDVIEEE